MLPQGLLSRHFQRRKARLQELWGSVPPTDFAAASLWQEAVREVMRLESSMTPDVSNSIGHLSSPLNAGFLHPTVSANAGSCVDKYQLNSWESEWFVKLGNEIMFQLVLEVDPLHPNELDGLGHDTREKRDERMRKLTESMKAGTTALSYGDYPWDPVSLISEISTRSANICISF